MISRRTRNLIGTVTVVAVLALVLALSGSRKAAIVKVQTMAPGGLNVVVNATTTSTVKSEYEVVLSAQRTGRVTMLAVRDGDRVRKGDLIAKLDLTEESVQSESVLAQSRATFREAEKNFLRSEELHQKGMIAQKELDTARRSFDVARSQYEAAAEDVRVRRDYSTIHAPFDGVVAKKSTEVGELLLPGKEIVTLVDPDRIYVLATIDEVDVGRLRLGQPVTVTVDAFAGEKFSGTVRRISPIVSGGKLETRTADVWIYFANKDGRIKPGMSADVEILIATLHNILSSPSQAIVDREGKKQVYVLDRKGLAPGNRATARLRAVEIGESNWSFTEIRNGLAPGDLVVTTPGAEGLKDGGRVTVQAVENARPGAQP